MLKSLEHYKGLAVGETRTVDLELDEECAVLKAYDYGVLALNTDELAILERVINKLKVEIWP